MAHIRVVGELAWTFQFDLHFRSKIFAKLTANWKTRGPTKLVKKNNKYNQPSR